MTLNIEQIKEILPHRDPMLLIDEVLELEPGKRAVALKHLTGEEDFFRGHFPGTPIMPGVLTIEAMAQAGAVAVLTMEQFRGKLGFLAGVDNARFKRKVVPGDILRLEVEIIKLRGPIGIGKGIAMVDGERVAYADITFAIS